MQNEYLNTVRPTDCGFKDLCWNYTGQTVINFLDKQPNFRWTIFQCPFIIFRCIDIVKFMKFRWHSTLLPCYHTPNYATITVFWDWPVAQKLRFLLCYIVFHSHLLIFLFQDMTLSVLNVICWMIWILPKQGCMENR